MFQIPKAGNARLPSRLPLANRIDFSPKNLFANDEPGVWFEANDATTLFTDVAGTTPVTAPGDAVAYQRDKSGRGNHRTQATTAARPLYALHPVGGVRNILTNTEEFDTRTVQVTPGEEYTLSFVSGESVVDLDETIASTAVDVFVYDTSKDSDGGAWRTGALAQATSWYNETLNTATRGSRREFPAVAVIVAEADKVTIYDGDDPSLPMWMVFNGGSTSYLIRNGISSLAAQNAEVVIGDGGTNGVLVRVNFISERIEVNFAGLVDVRLWSNVANRNVQNDYISDSTVPDIVNRYVNDVATTVLPDAPIDAATGLPVPTIAVATAGGVSVIKDDGTVVDSASTLGFRNVAFTPENYLWATRNNFVVGYIYTDQYFSDGFGSLFNSTWRQPAESSASSITPLSNLVTAQRGSTFGGLRKKGFSLSRTELGSPETADHCFFTSTYNTGWMPGDIKGAFLSDTDDTDLVGSTIYTSDFSSGVDGWTAEGQGTLAAVSSELELTGDGGFNDAGKKALTVVSGKRYIITGKFRKGTNATTRVQVQEGFGSFLVRDRAETNSATLIDFKLEFVASGTPYNLKLVDWTGGGGTCYIKDVSVKLADEDRSVNQNGLVINGTITRTPVATGADLVGYSGFSSSNYLEQPYNSDLDFGTGDFCVMGWVNTGDTERGGIVFRRDAVTSSQNLNFRKEADGTINLLLNGGSRIQGGTNIETGTWLHIAVVRGGGTLYLYVNGASDASPVADTNDLTFVNGSTLYVGNRDALDHPFGGSLALLRISATAPTAEQIAKIYNDEKVLFQENAQATLYGSSDAVTALAHDPDTDLLHVGTSAGRSVFNGLLRVNNTTTGVTTAISAANGVIGEQ